MIEFKETHHPERSYMMSQLRATGLPADHWYTIYRYDDGHCTARSRASGNGSIRYYDHATYDDAMAHATKWAQRKIREAAKDKPLLIETELMRLFGR